jgi:AmmeMemoRadiSam system protein B
MHERIRQPAVAGLFYPSDPEELQGMVDSFLDEAVAPGGEKPPKALIVPHAGYVYSGPVAASAYARVRALRGKVSRVVLFGPSHRVPLRGLAASSATHFSTPLGLIPLDRRAIDDLLQFDQVRLMNEAHAHEHSLEVHLPFLQRIFGQFALVPLVVGDARADEVGEVLDRLWGGDETLIVISSDLSHYHDYATAQRMDRETSRAIEALSPEKIAFDDACGRIPVSGLLNVARRIGLQAQTIDLRNSGDTAGPRDQVVGYGAYVFH